MPSCFQINKNRTLQDVMLEVSPGSSADDPKRVVVVMDALKEFDAELLEWVLKNITFRECCTITLLGIMPWLNIPLSSKTWSEIWSMNLEDLSGFQEKNESKNDLKCQKVQRLIDLCQQYGVVPEIRTEMGHPIRLLVVEQITSLHATLVVFDRHHDKKYIEYYAEKVPCTMVAVNDAGEVYLIKKRRCCDSEPETTTPAGDSTASNSIFSDHIRKYFNPKTRGTSIFSKFASTLE